MRVTALCSACSPDYSSLCPPWHVRQQRGTSSEVSHGCDTSPIVILSLCRQLRAAAAKAGAEIRRLRTGLQPHWHDLCYLGLSNTSLETPSPVDRAATHWEIAGWGQER
jgi:hypothetical protein